MVGALSILDTFLLLAGQDQLGENCINFFMFGYPECSACWRYSGPSEHCMLLCMPRSRPHGSQLEQGSRVGMSGCACCFPKQAKRVFKDSPASRGVDRCLTMINRLATSRSSERSAGRGLFRKGVVRFSLEIMKTTETTDPQDEILKSTPFLIL